MTFDEAMPYIYTICNKWARMFRDLERDELVNEVWLRCDFSKFVAPRGSGMTRHIEYQIIDYIRKVFGRPGFKGHSKRQRTGRLVGDAQGQFTGFDEIDSADAFNHLLSGLEPKSRQIIDMYYNKGLTQSQIGKELGRAESNISFRRHQILKHLREQVA